MNKIKCKVKRKEKRSRECNVLSFYLAANVTNMEMNEFPQFYYNTIPNTTICRQETYLGADENFLAKTDFIPKLPSHFEKPAPI